MIELYLHKNRIYLSLDENDQYYDRAYMVVRSLLSSKEIKNNIWTINYDDVRILKYKLDMIGLVDNRVITDECFEYIEHIDNINKLNSDIKSGLYNNHTKQLLAKKLKSVLYEDQIPAVSYAINNRRVGIFDEMGSGKTLISLASIVALGRQVKRSLIICPYTIMLDFKDEIGKHTDLKYVIVPRGRNNAINFIKDNVDGDWDLMLVHPENLISEKSGKNNIYGDITNMLCSMVWDMIIVDEFHMYKNWDAKRTKCVSKIINESVDMNGEEPRLIVMTGTPVSESPLNAYVVLKLIGNGYMPHITIFENYFCVKEEKQYGKKGKHKKIVSYKNLDELSVMINNVSIRRTKKEMTGFPDRVFLVRHVELYGKQLLLYKAICGEIIRDLPEHSLININNFLNNSTKILRLRQILNHPSILNEDGDSSKYIELDMILDELFLDSEQKVVLWTEFRSAVDLLYERYNDLYGAVKIYGGVDNDQLSVIKNDFELINDGPRVAICIPAKAGVGVDFLARARTAIYVDRPYSFVYYKQSLDRIHRRIRRDTSSKLDEIRSSPATIMFLDVVDSVDSLVRDKLLGKQDVFDVITNNKEAIINMNKSDLIKYLR